MLAAIALIAMILLLRAVVIARVVVLRMTPLTAPVLALLVVVFFMIDPATLTVFGHLDIFLFVAANVPIGAGTAFHPVCARLPLFEAAGFLGCQLAGFDTLFDALLLVDVALNVGLHAL